MPELPEVETVALQMHSAAAGKTITQVRCRDPKLRRSARQIPLRYRINEVTRIGKQIVFVLAKKNDRCFLAVHLRMSGRLLFANRLPPEALPHLRLTLELNGGALLFVDPRRFGTVKLAKNVSTLAPRGLDPLRNPLNSEIIHRLIAGSRQSIKSWLLRQDRLVGIGNIYASEILFTAKIKPTRQARTLRSKELVAVVGATKRILNDAIRHSGTTFSDFQDAHGLTGSYQRFLKVYERDNQPCRRCKTPIRRIVQQQRSSYYCPRCQR